MSDNTIDDFASMLIGENGSISDDGRYMAFQSQGTNLVPGDTNGYVDIFVRISLQELWF